MNSRAASAILDSKMGDPVERRDGENRVSVGGQDPVSRAILKRRNRTLSSMNKIIPLRDRHPPGPILEIA